MVIAGWLTQKPVKEGAVNYATYPFQKKNIHNVHFMGTGLHYTGASGTSWHVPYLGSILSVFSRKDSLAIYIGVDRSFPHGLLINMMKN